MEAIEVGVWPEHCGHLFSRNDRYCLADGNFDYNYFLVHIICLVVVTQWQKTEQSCCMWLRSCIDYIIISLVPFPFTGVMKFKTTKISLIWLFIKISTPGNYPPYGACGQIWLKLSNVCIQCSVFPSCKSCAAVRPTMVFLNLPFNCYM